MNNFDRLKEQIESGALSMIHIEAVPRSVSTAFARALNEIDAPSVYINEPFNRYTRDVDVAAGFILEVTDPITSKGNEPLTIITKSTSRNLSTDNFKDWMTISQGVAWTIRNPLTQMASLITRYANDIFFGSESDVLKQEDLKPEHFEAVNDYLMHGPKNNTGPKHPGNFSNTSWEDIGLHFRSTDKPERSVVIDEAEFTTHPVKVMGHACEVLGLEYTDGMVNGWQKDIINVNLGYNQTEMEIKDMAWVNHAMTSTGIEQISRDPIDVTRLPKEIQDHINNVAMPIYQEMIKIGG